MSITAAVVCALSLLAVLLAAFYIVFMYLFILAAIICTIGIILLYFPNLFDLVDPERTSAVIRFLSDNVAPPAAIISAAAGALSLLFLILGEPKRDAGRIIFSGLITLLAAVVTILLLSSGDLQ